MIEDDILVKLQELSFGTVGKDLFKGLLLTEPDNLVLVRTYDSGPTDLAWNGEYPYIQITVRNKKYDSGQAKIQAIYNALHGICEEVINGTRYLLISATQVPILLTIDKSERKVFTCNFSVIKEI